MDEQPLEIVDEIVPLLPHLLRDELVHAHHQHIFVMRAVEDADVTEFGRALVDAPQEIVGELLFRRLLESGDAAALGIHAFDDVPADAVLAGGVDALQHDQ